MRKMTLLALLVFAGLAAATFSLRGRKPERGITRVSFVGLETAAIDRFEVSGKNPIVAEKKDGRWVLGDGRAADAAAIQAALDAAGQLESSDLITSTPARFADLEVDDAKGSKVKLSAAGRGVAEFVVGKWAASGAYLRVGDDVYLSRKLSPHVFSKPSAGWHDLVLFADKLEEMTRIEIALAGSPPYALIQKDGAWQFEDPAVAPAGLRFDAAAARGLATALSSLKAKDVVATDPGPQAAGLEGAGDVIVFTAKDQRRELHLGAATQDGGVYARVVGKPDLYALAASTAKGLRKQPADFHDLALVKLDTAKVQRLVVEDGARRLELLRQGPEWAIAKSSEAVAADYQLDRAAVERRVGMLASARALRLRREVTAEAAALLKPRAAIRATVEGGDEVVLAFGAEVKEEGGPEGVFARGNADAQVYVVGKYLRDQLLGGLDSLKRREGPAGGPGGIDPNALKDLPPEVRKSLLEQLSKNPPSVQ